jgi:hypothetical protein
MNALETLMTNAKPMTDFDGNPMPNEFIVKRILNRDTVNALIFIAESSGNCGYRDTGKHTYRNFVIGQTAYTIKLVISRSARREVQLTSRSINPCDYLTASDLWEGQ